MQFYFKDIQATYLIEKDSSQFQNENFSKKNLKLIEQRLAMMTN